MATLKAFTKEIDGIKDAQLGNTDIYRVDFDNVGPHWKPASSRPSRSLESVSLDEAVKQPLVADIKQYLDPEDKKSYSDLGIPHRRGYIFHGPPGTGKTSISCALAGHFHLDVYMISMSHSDLDDDALVELFDQLPAQCMVLLEDIDSAGVGRENMKSNNKKKKGKKGNGDDGSSEHAGVTLSGLLNAIDGPYSADDRVLVMTSNSINSLDEALIRPGRIDRKVYFGNASVEVATNLFMHIFSNSSTLTQDSLKGMATTFVSRIPAGKLTPAEILNTLLEHRHDPTAAVAGIEEAVAAILAAKEQRLNVLEPSIESETVVTTEPSTNNELVSLLATMPKFDVDEHTKSTLRKNDRHAKGAAKRVPVRKCGKTWRPM